MSQNIRVHYGYKTISQLPVGNVDVRFYQKLPEVEEEYVGANGLPEIPLPDLEQEVIVSGSTILSSASIATIIASWIKERPRKIVLSNAANQKLEFEGPDLTLEVAGIQHEIEKLAENSNYRLGIEATTLPASPSDMTRS